MPAKPSKGKHFDDIAGLFYLQRKSKAVHCFQIINKFAGISLKIARQQRDRC